MTSPVAAFDGQPQGSGQPRPFRILALDGGGVKGAYTASVLATLEEVTGRDCRDHFDLIAGTSTGGIIALGLGLGLSARSLSDFYRDKGELIFPISGVIGRHHRAARHLSRPKHDVQALRDALESVFGDRTMGDSTRPLVIPAYDITESRVYIFKTGHDPRFRFDRELSAVDIALATSAAPSYFPAAGVRRAASVRRAAGADFAAGADPATNARRAASARYVDGGVWANCPAMVALTEAIAFFSIAPQDIDILSIGTTTTPFVVSARQSSGGLLNWGGALVELLMTSQVQAAEAQASLLTHGGWHRINHVTGRGRFRLDKAEHGPDLQELGRSDAVKRQHLEAVEQRFLCEPVAKPFLPVP